MNNGKLLNKVAIITGSASGIGRSTAERFVNEGAKVVLADINLDAIKTISESLGENSISVHLDVSEEAGWERAIKACIDKFGKLDVVCNIAGVGVAGSIEELSIDDWNKMVAVNLTGVLLGCKHGIKAIRETKGNGAIINVSSIGGLVGIADVAGYCATKGGVTTLTKSVALYCAEQGLPIRSISIHPTYVDTEMLDPIAEAVGSREELINSMSSQVPMGRVAKPADIAASIVFAASDEAAMISGSGIIIDGAQLAGPSSTHS